MLLGTIYKCIHKLKGKFAPLPKYAFWEKFDILICVFPGVKIELRQISTSLANCRNDPAQIAGPNMMTKMLRRQKYIFDQCKKDQAQKQNRRQKPSKLTFEDNSKTEAFNTLFQQNLLLVLHSPPFCNYFANSGLTITKVRLKSIVG